MESIFKNGIIFLSGFAIALVFYNDPIGFNSNSNLASDIDVQDVDSFSKAKRPLNANAKVIQNAELITSSKSNSQSRSSMLNGYSSRPSLNDVPNIDERYAEQIPTAPPTGRPEAEEGETEETAENENNDAQEPQKKIANNKETYDFDKNKNEDSEKSMSSMSPLVGAIVNQANNVGSNTDVKATPVKGSGGSGGVSVRPPVVDVTPSDVLPSTFTQEGLAIAKRLIASSSLSETEYLDYLNLGLQSNDTALSGLALNELVALKSRNSFLLMTQYASTSDSNFNQAILNNYKTASDLRFLSQMIADDSSLAAQNLAVYSLDVVLNGNAMNFDNQQVRDTLIQNVYPSLNRLPNSHPSFNLAKSISEGISELFS